VQACDPWTGGECSALPPRQLALALVAVSQSCLYVLVPLSLRTPQPLSPHCCTRSGAFVLHTRPDPHRLLGLPRPVCLTYLSRC
jgi:hypothetical protein